MFELDYFTLPSGEQPVDVFLKSMDVKLRAKVYRSFQLLEDKGNQLREPDSKHLEDGIYELRTTLGGNTGRVLFFFFDGRRIILTHGFIKKSQKTPRREIDKAKRYRKEHLRQWKEADNE